jgi:hypothetical protein
MDTIDGNNFHITHEGEPRAARMSLCGGHHYFETYSSKCTRCEATPRILYCVIGTDYGFLHNAFGDVRTWKSASGARRAAKRYKSFP